MGGEAKRRGSFEERKAQSILRKKEEEEKCRIEWLEKEAKMTAEEKLERNNAQKFLTGIAPMWLGNVHRLSGLRLSNRNRGI